MASQSHYEVNVSLNGYHLFATAERSAVTNAQARQLLLTFKEKFPEADGYKVTATYWKTVGKKID